MYLTRFIQLAGGMGSISSTFWINPTYAHGNQYGVDDEQHTVFGTKITTYSGAVSANLFSSEDSFTNFTIFEENVVKYSCIVTFNSNDSPVFLNFIRQPFGICRISSVILIFISILLLPGFIILITRLIKSKGVVGFFSLSNPKGLLLIVEVYVLCIRIVYVTDPIGIFGYIPYLISAVLIGSQIICMIFTKFCLLLIWLDALESVKAGLKLKLRNSVFLNPLVGRTTLFSLIALMILDITFSVRFAYKQITFFAYVIEIYIGVVLTVIISLLCFFVSF